jgi:hypothetical protein
MTMTDLLILALVVCVPAAYTLTAIRDARLAAKDDANELARGIAMLVKLTEELKKSSEAMETELELMRVNER